MVTADTLHKRATRVLPQVIQTSGVLLADNAESEIATLLFPLRRKSSGSVMFRLSAQTIANLSDNPAGYLTQATCARQGMGRHARPFTYRPWRKAVLPVGRLDAAPLEVYFTTKTDGKALLVLVPAERLLVYAWND